MMQYFRIGNMYLMGWMLSSTPIGLTKDERVLRRVRAGSLGLAYALLAGFEYGMKEAASR